MVKVIPPPDMNLGTMTPQWTVWCGWCVKWDQACGTKSRCNQEFKLSGWKKHGGKWMCPECAAKYGKAVAA